MARYARLRVVADRVRNNLAFCAGMPIPSVALLASSDVLFPLQMDCPPDRYLPELDSVKTLEGQATWKTNIAEAFKRAERITHDVRPDEPAGRAASLVGEAVWTVDPEERLFYAWRALEVVATKDLADARSKVEAGDMNAASPYFRLRAKTLLNDNQAVRIDPLLKVEVSLATRAPTVTSKRLSEFYNLRTTDAGRNSLTLLEEKRLLT